MVLYENISVNEYKYLFIIILMYLIFENNNSLNEVLCDDIIELFEENNINGVNEKQYNIYNIPKNNVSWERIERLIYKEILVRLNEYKNNLICDMNNNNLISLLSKTLYTKHLSIQKIYIGEKFIDKFNFIPNRYNVLTFVFFLNYSLDGGEIIIKINNKDVIIKPEKGKFVLFPEDIDYPYKFNLPKNTPLYIVSGQLCYDNII